MSTAELAFEDILTGAYNRRYLLQLLSEGWRAAMARHAAISVLILDLDAFKEINDSHGHLTGDDVLRATARILRSHFRASDLVVRYGGDEFVVLAFGADAAEATRLAERAREALGEETVVSSRSGKTVDIRGGFSIGAASYPEDGDDGAQLLQIADRRLYEDKRRRGRAPSWLWRHRKVVSGLLAAGAIAGLALGSYLGAKVRTSVVPARSLNAPAAAVSLVVELRLRIAELERRLAAAEALNAALSVPPPVAPRLVVPPLPARTPPLAQGATGPGARSVPMPPAPAALATATPPDPLLEAARDLQVAQEEGRAAQPEGPPVAGPEPIELVPPEYPRMARAIRQQASIELRLTVNENGRVTSAEPTGPRVGFGFEEAAAAAARKTRFRPGRNGETPATMETYLVYRFILDRD